MFFKKKADYNINQRSLGQSRMRFQCCLSPDLVMRSFIPARAEAVLVSVASSRAARAQGKARLKIAV